MPLLKIDVVKGRSDEDLKNLLDNLHDAMVEAFEVPNRDRYQILHEHERSRMIIQDTGLGFTRTDNIVVVTATRQPSETAIFRKH